MARRPENVAPPEEFYNDDEASKYAKSSRMATMQRDLAERCLELLAFPNDGTPQLLLDIGTGTAISGEVLSRHGHHWVGADISRPMLLSALDKEVEGDLLQADAGLGIAMRMGTLDGAISVSAIQWLCCAGQSDQTPFKRLNAFFTALYSALRHSARAALQFYPESSHQIDMISDAAMRAGFSGGLLVDYPNSTKAKKYYLVLTAGPPPKGDAMPKPLGLDAAQAYQNTVHNEPRKSLPHSSRRRRGAEQVSRRDTVIAKKDRKRRQGHSIRPDTKFTGRKRRNKF